MVHFVGAGSGAPDLITVRGKRLLMEADVIIYAGSLVNPALLDDRKEGAKVYNSATMTLEEVIAVMAEAEEAGQTTVRLHTGDPCIYGAIREQMDALEARGIEYDTTPGVSSFLAAAAALNIEYTLPDVSQSVVITRMEGRTPVPGRESIESFAAHRASMAIFLSAGRRSFPGGCWRAAMRDRHLRRSSTRRRGPTSASSSVRWGRWHRPRRKTGLQKRHSF